MARKNTGNVLNEYLKAVMEDPQNAHLDIKELPRDLRDFGKNLAFLGECLKENRELGEKIQKGDLSLNDMPSEKNPLAAPLKVAHSNMRHIAWHARQIELDDYSQRLDFMGELGDQFNHMTEHLQQRMDASVMAGGTGMSGALNRNMELIQALASHMNKMIFAFDMEGNQIYINKSAEWFEKVVPRCIDEIREQMTSFNNFDSGQATWEIEVADEIKGVVRYFTVESFLFNQDRAGNGAIAHIISDDTERRNKENLVQSMAYTDPLTGLQNLRAAEELMEKWMEHGEEFMVSLIDLDGLKECNDHHGHKSGDRYLKDATKALSIMSGQLCRIGGDEFVLLSIGNDVEMQNEKLDTIRTALLGDMSVPWRMSFSFATEHVPADTDMSIDDIMNNADLKMYEYKQNNKVLGGSTKKGFGER